MDYPVDKKNNECLYNDEIHKYWHEETKKQYTSVTTFISEYKEKFDANYWSAYKTLERILPLGTFASYKRKYGAKNCAPYLYKEQLIDKDEFNTVRAEIIAEWDAKKEKACEHGTNFHLAKEHGWVDYEAHFIKGKKFITSHTYDLSDLEDGVYPEFLVYNNEYGLAGQVDLLIKDGKDIIIADYKGLEISTPILTKDGYIPIGDIKIGDTVFDINGNQTKVEHVSSIHYNPCYKITFDTNDVLIADHEHKWILNDGEFSTEDIYKRYLDTKTKKQELRIRIPNQINIEESNELPIDPYVLGLWLGDGASACGTITCVNSTIWDEVRSRGYKVGNDTSAEDRAESRCVFGLVTKLKTLNLIHNKHIPDCYITASYDTRLDLLRGFMDADGYFHKKRNRFVMATTKKWQAVDTAKLVASLGFKPTILPCNKYLNGRVFEGWDTCFYMDINPFLCRNQDIVLKNTSHVAKYRFIKSIERIDTVPTKCIAVDSPTKSYLAGYSLIPTHNTNKQFQLESFRDRKNGYKMMQAPLDKLMDCHMGHYTAQLNLYAWMVCQLGDFNIKQLMIEHYDRFETLTKYEVPIIQDTMHNLVNDGLYQGILTPVGV